VFIANEWSITETGGEVQVSWGVFTSDGRQEEELDTRMGKASAVMRALQYISCYETRIVEKSKALGFQNNFRSHPHLRS